MTSEIRSITQRCSFDGEVVGSGMCMCNGRDIDFQNELSVLAMISTVTNYLRQGRVAEWLIMTKDSICHCGEVCK